MYIPDKNIRQNMLYPGIQEKLLHQLAQLSADKQQQVLAFAEALASQAPIGIPGKALLRFAGSINAEDIAIMKRAIHEGCEQIDRNEW